jgi:hypothetical protein
MCPSYPEDNCGVNGNYLNAQDIYSEWLNHTSVTNLTTPYFDGTRQALAAGKEMIMFETNTASCGGFAGLSDSFAATLWYVIFLTRSVAFRLTLMPLGCRIMPCRWLTETSQPRLFTSVDRARTTM